VIRANLSTKARHSLRSSNPCIFAPDSRLKCTFRWIPVVDVDIVESSESSSIYKCVLRTLYFEAIKLSKRFELN